MGDAGMEGRGRAHAPTSTLPGFMDSTISWVISFGAGLPGMSAVVTTTSTSLHCSANSFISASMNSWLISLAYPPSPPPISKSPSTSTNSAPNDSTCSLTWSHGAAVSGRAQRCGGTWRRTSGRVSKQRTTAPMFLAAPMAERPATPPPTTRTLAGGMRPAAVIWPPKKRPNSFMASTMAR